MFVGLSTMCEQYLWMPVESVRSSGSGVTGVCDSLCGCWESNWIHGKKIPYSIAGPLLQLPLST